MTKRQQHYPGLGRHTAAWLGTEFIAPVGVRAIARLRVVPHEYVLRVSDPQPGWWRVRVSDSRHVERLAPAESWERGEWLEPLTPQRYILLERDEGQSWLALRWLDRGTPDRSDQVIIDLVEHGYPFDVVWGRQSPDRAIWYDDHDRRADPQRAEVLRQALAEERDPWADDLIFAEPMEQHAYAYLVQMRAMQQEREAQRLAHAAHFAALRDEERRHAEELRAARLLQDEETLNASLEVVQSTLGHEAELLAAMQEASAELASPLTSRGPRHWARRRWKEAAEAFIRFKLALGGAILVGFEGAHDSPHISVTWQRGPYRGVVRLDHQLTLQHAGICLAGHDAWFDLASVISVTLHIEE